MMEPVAPANDRQIELMKDFWAYYGSPPHKREFDARLLKKDFLSLIVRLSDAEARIAELEAALDHDPDGSGLWRYWASKSSEIAQKLVEQIDQTTAAEARAEAAEALLKEAGPIIETFAEIGDYVLAEAPPDATMWYAGHSCTGEHMAQVSLEYFRAARSLMSKIGERNGE